MSERALKRLVAVLLGVIALWIIAGRLPRGGGPIPASGTIASFFDGVDEKAVSEAWLSGSSGPIELHRQGDAWTVNGFVPDSAVVSRFWTVLSETTVGDLASMNPVNHDRMGVSQDSAVRLELRIGGERRVMLVGDRGPRFGTVYGRLPDEDQVYVLEGDLASLVGRRIDDWRSKRVLSTDTSRVFRIEVEGDGDSMVLLRGDSLWTFEEGGATDASAIRGLLGELSDLKASGFLTEGDSLATMPEGASTVAYSAAGEVLAHVTLGSGSGERWAKAEGNDVLYRLAAYQSSRIVPTRDQLEPDP